MGDYDWLLAADKAVYPTDRPVDLRHLDQWYQRNPEFGIFCGRNHGVCAAIPLSRTGWEALIAGRLAESDLDSATVFDITRDNAIGIHVYHIERSPQAPTAFYLHALQNLGATVSQLRNIRHDLAVCGFSGLCVTPQSVGLFKDKLSCRESHLVSTEHIMRRYGRLVVFDLRSDTDIEAKLAEGYQLVNRCQMLVTAPGDPSIVWQFLRQ